MFTTYQKPNAELQCLRGTTTTHLPFDLGAVHAADRNAAYALAFGAGLKKLQENLDPDLHSPVLSEILLRPS